MADEHQDQGPEAPPNTPGRILKQWDGWDGDRKRLYIRRKVNRSVRYRILKRDGFRCQLCGRGKDDLDDEGKPVRLHVDHILPIAAGGASDDSNLQTLCFDCNRGKGDAVEGFEDDEEQDQDEAEVEPVEQEEPARPVTERFQAGDVLPNGTVFDPEQHAISRNGTVYDKTTGRFLSPPAPEHAPITPRNAQALARKRWEDSRNAFAAGLAEGTIGKDTSPIRAWGRVGRKAAQLLMDAKSARGFADLARFAGEAAGFVPMARGREELQETEPQQPAIVNLIFQFMADRTEPPNVIDAE